MKTDCESEGSSAALLQTLQSAMSELSAPDNATTAPVTVGARITWSGKWKSSDESLTEDHSWFPKIQNLGQIIQIWCLHSFRDHTFLWRSLDPDDFYETVWRWRKLEQRQFLRHEAVSSVVTCVLLQDNGLADASSLQNVSTKWADGHDV